MMCQYYSWRSEGKCGMLDCPLEISRKVKLNACLNEERGIGKGIEPRRSFIDEIGRAHV